jgi:hypothetical protein
MILIENIGLQEKRMKGVGRPQSRSENPFSDQLFSAFLEPDRNGV